MANQINPNVYHLTCRCPIEDIAAVRTAAEKDGLSVGSWVAKLIHGTVKDLGVDESAKEWMSNQWTRNLELRERADLLTASGKYRVKRMKKLGRHKKPGPKRGSHWKVQQTQFSGEVLNVVSTES